MIVVVIIGLLAAISIPAFKKVRNKSLENALVYDGKQLSAAASIYMSENPVSVVPVRSLANAIPQLSAGVGILSSVGDKVPVVSAFLSGTNNRLEFATGQLGKDGRFVLTHSAYDSSWSSSSFVKPGLVEGNVSAIRFSVETGMPVAD